MAAQADSRVHEAHLSADPPVAGGVARAADQPSPDVDGRLRDVASAADLAPVAEALRVQREAILRAWLAAARRQPFHREHPDRAVADHIPALFDAVVDLLGRTAAPGDDAGPPMHDPAIDGTARAHARVRFEQQLGPVAIATEFRLLRQEIGRALQRFLDDDLPAGDIVAALTLVNDALDGATMVALSALTERVEAVREEFLASTIHDVRQPITLVEASLVLASRWVRQAPPDVERLAETLTGALHATQEMSQLVDTLADASRVAMGAVDIDPEPVIVRDVVNDALELLDPAGRARIDVGELPSTAIGDWDRRAVRRILTNLLTNALKYSPPTRRVRVTGSQAANRATIEIVDQGIGLEPEELEVLFRRYGRTDDARARGVPGLGLGLYASQGLAVAHGGRIELESAGRDRGVRARLELPLTPGLD
jgi:signal transduction histidine kinase